MSSQAYIADFLQQREEAKAAARAAARAEDQKIKDYWSMVSCAVSSMCRFITQSVAWWEGHSVHTHNHVQESPQKPSKELCG